MTIMHRLYDIARAYFRSYPDRLDEELRKWEEEIKARKSRKETQQQQQFFTPKLKEAFRTLEVDSGANFEICKKAYRKLANKYHPDRWHEAVQEKKDNADTLFKAISKAFAEIKKYYGEK